MHEISALLSCGSGQLLEQAWRICRNPMLDHLAMCDTVNIDPRMVIVYP
jgi:hypothetical protein